jgi:superoxide dismutase, Fe-Mn family
LNDWGFAFFDFQCRMAAPLKGYAERSFFMNSNFSPQNLAGFGFGGWSIFQAASDTSVTQAVDPTLASAFKEGKYVLPPLPYSYEALEPLYDRKTVEIHYTKHHAKYVQDLNASIEKLQNARKQNDFSAIKAVSRDLAFNGSGHILHCLFWNSMTPGGSKPSTDLIRAISQDFGSLEVCQAQFAAAAKAVEGSGWAVLAWEPVGKQLLILQCEKHQNLTIWGVTPLLVCDVWEHAYYLQYANDRAKWVDNFMKLANWQFASERFALAKK